MGTFSIPSGQKVIFDDFNADVSPALSNIDFFLAEDISISLTSRFKSLVDGNPPTFFSLLAGVTTQAFKFSVSGQYKEFGFQVWDSTDPVSINFSVELKMRTDAKADVYDPLKRLVKLPLPVDQPGNVGGLQPPGPSILSLLQNNSSSAGRFLTISFGRITLTKAILLQAEPSVARFTDDSAYPIYAKISCVAQSSQIATDKYIDSLLP